MTDDVEFDAGRRAQLMAIVERLARRYAGNGFSHPRVAALVVTLRGLDGVDRAAWAAQLGISESDLADAESGRTAAGDLDERLTRHAAAVGLPI